MGILGGIMEGYRSFVRVNRQNFLSRREFLSGLGAVIILIMTLDIMSTRNNLLFHSAVEVFSSVIFFGVFIIAVNTYSMSKNKFLVLLGIGYFFVAIIDLLHAAAYPGVSILYKEGNANVAAQLGVAARYIGALTSLASTILFYKPIKNFRRHFIFIAYFFITTFLILSIFYFKIFPTCYTPHRGFTHFKIISEYIVSLIYLLVAVLYYSRMECVDFELFFYMEGFLITIILSELFLASYLSPFDDINITGHLLKFVACCFMYNAVIKLGLKKPYAVLFHDLNKVDRELKITTSRLKEEAKQREYFEETLIKNEHCYDLIINNSSDAITISCEGKIVFANGRAAQIYGVKRPVDLIGMEAARFLYGDIREDAVKERERAIEDQTSLPLKEFKVVSMDGRIIDVEVSSGYISYHGRHAFISIFRDISSQKKIKELENDIVVNQKVINETMESNRQMAEFFANVSHELKTPLNVILGAIQVFGLHNDAKLPEAFETKLDKYMKIMKQNCYRILRLVNNLIDLSKLDSGYFRLNLYNHNIVSVVEDITLSVADYIENRGVELVFDTDTEEKYMAVDTDKIERIILNLLSNAIKFTDEGDRISVNIEDKIDSVIISVKDTGIGIPEDKLELIFERFGQVDKTLSRNHEGSGIGLSLVKSLIEMHEGTIKVKSQIGEGSEFIIELPVRVVQGAEIEEKSLYQSKVERINIEFSDIYSQG